MNHRKVAAAAVAILLASASWVCAEEPIIELERRAGMVASGDATTKISVWADGTVLVHLPSYLKRAGDYRGKLSGSELAALVDSVVLNEIADLTTDEVRAARARASAAREQRSSAGTGEVRTIVTDPDPVTLTVRIGMGPTRANEAHVLSYVGVRNDAAAWPEVAELQRLDAVVSDVSDIAGHRSLEKQP
jgi:hypothetical protein